MLTCCTCEETGFNRNALEMHIATTHIFYNAYECEHCKTALFPSEFALRQHYQQDHRQKVFYIRYRVTPELDKKREVLETLIRKSISNSNNADDDGSSRGDGANMNDTTPNFIPNIDHLEASQLLSCIQAGPANAGSSFSSALVKYDIDDPEAGESSVSDPMVGRNGDVANSYGGCQISYSTSSTASGKAVTAVQGLLSINNNGIQMDSSQMQQQSQQQHQIQLANGGQVGPQFLQVQPPGGAIYANTFTQSIGDMPTDNGAVGPELLAKLLIGTKPNGSGDSPLARRHGVSPNGGESTKRQPRVSTQIQCVECGGKVSNYMNSLVLHVSTHHCDLPVYECLSCSKQWFSLSARFKDHMKSRHDGNMSLLKDNRQAIMPLLKEKAIKLFPQHRFT